MTHISEEILREYLAGTVPLQKEIEIMEHIAVCDRCAKCFADMMTDEMQVTPPPDLKSGILEQTVYRKNTLGTLQELQAKKQKKRKEFFAYTFKVGIAMAASILMVINMSANVDMQQNQRVAENRQTVAQSMQKQELDKRGKRNKISGSLQKASGKMGDALNGFLDIFGNETE